MRRDPIIIASIWLCVAIGMVNGAMALSGGNILNVASFVFALFVFFHYKDRILF